MTIRRRCADRAQPRAARRLCEGGATRLSLLHRSRWIAYGTAIAIGLAGTDPRDTIG
jgi:hypothetical protein